MDERRMELNKVTDEFANDYSEASDRELATALARLLEVVDNAAAAREGDRHREQVEGGLGASMGRVEVLLAQQVETLGFMAKALETIAAHARRKTEQGR